MTFRSRFIRPAIVVLGVLVLAGGSFARSGAAPVSGPPPFTVAVLGDAFGEAVADGLKQELAGDATLVILPSTHAPYGLADQRFDWMASTRALLTERQIGAAVIMIGADDLRPLRDGTATVEPLTPRWEELYGDRVTLLAALFVQKGISLTWVGLPIVADDETATGYSALNETIRARATEAGARYVDVWNAFADDGGRFDPNGPDKDGKPARLRSSDGRLFTRAGCVKLASFVEGNLQRARQAALATLAVTTDVVLPREPEVENDVNAQIRRELGLPSLAPSSRDAKGPVITVTAPPQAPDGRLVAASIGPAPLPNAGGMSLAQRALVEGRPLAPKPGRIDDFSWPRVR